MFSEGGVFTGLETRLPARRTPSRPPAVPRTKSSILRCTEGVNEYFCDFINTLEFTASAEGSSDNFSVFRTDSAYDVILFKFLGVGQLLQVAGL